MMSYSTVSMALRPPRVVVVFDGGDQWTYWARRALHLAGQVCGGRGFAVVPHRNGQVDSALLRACRAYDPDFVVTFPRTVEELERLEPGWFQIKGEDGQLLTGPGQERMFNLVKDRKMSDPADVAARERIVEVCSPYRTRLNADTWHEDVTVLQDVGTRHFPDALAIPGPSRPGSGMLIFATTAPLWTDRTVRSMQSGVEEFAWGPLSPPEVRLIMGLGARPEERPLVSTNVCT